MSKKLNNNGFTIVELLIAISVFSTLLIIIVYSFIYGLDTFIKDQIVSNTQETTRSIEQNITQNLSLTPIGSYTPIKSTTTTIKSTTTNTTTNVTSQGFCIGDYRYSYILDQQLTSNIGGLVQDTVAGCSSTDFAIDLSNKKNLTSSSRQLLGDNMQISQLNISPIDNTNGFILTIEIDYGSNFNSGSNDYTYSCPSGNISASYCAVDKVDTYVFQGIQ